MRLNLPFNHSFLANLSHELNNTAMTKEIELKLRLDPELNPDQMLSLVTFLNEQAQPEGSKTLENTYFDSANAELSAAKTALRIRQKGDAFEQTLKTAGSSRAGLHERREWNWPLSSNQLDADVLADAEVQQHWPDGVEVADLAAVFATNFERQVWNWTSGDTSAEVVIDKGLIIAGERTQPLCEIELELTAGNADGLWAMAQQLSELAPLWLSDISKAERGYRLADIGVQWSAANITLDETTLLAQAVPLWLQQSLSGFKRSLESTLWEQDSQAALELYQHWHTLRHLPQWCGKIVKRKFTKDLRQALDTLQARLESLSALTTAGRFLNAPELRAQWLQQAEAVRNDTAMSAALLAIAHWAYEHLPLMLEAAQADAGVSGESVGHYWHRSWKEAQDTLATPHESWHPNQWADYLSQTSRLQHLYELRHLLLKLDAGARLQRERRLLADMLNGQSLIQSLLAQPDLVAAEQAEQFQQELPYELFGRWQELRTALR